MSCSEFSTADNNSPPNKSYKRLVDYSQRRAQSPPCLAVPVVVEEERLCQFSMRRSSRRSSSSSSSYSQNQLLDPSSSVLDKPKKNTRRRSCLHITSPTKGAPKRPIVMMTAQERSTFGLGSFGMGGLPELAASTAETVGTTKRDSLSTLATTSDIHVRSTPILPSEETDVSNRAYRKHQASWSTSLNYTEHTTATTGKGADNRNRERREKMIWLANNHSQRNLRQKQVLSEAPPPVIKVIFATGKAPVDDSTRTTDDPVLQEPADVSTPLSSTGTDESTGDSSTPSCTSDTPDMLPFLQCGSKPENRSDPPSKQRVLPAHSWSLKTLAGEEPVLATKTITRRSSTSFVAGSQIRTINRGTATAAVYELK